VARLVCEKCGAEQDVPVVHCGPGKLSECKTMLCCPMEGHTETTPIPEHCEVPMKYVEEGTGKSSCCK